MSQTEAALARLQTRDHRSALWCLGLLYRRPRVFQEALNLLPRRSQLLVALRLYLNFLPYLIGGAALGRWFLFAALRLELEAPMGLENLFAHAYWIAGGIAIGVTVGIAFGIAGGIARAVARGIARAVAREITKAATGEIAIGIASGIAFGIALGVTSGIDVGIAGGVAQGIVRGIGIGVGIGIAANISGEAYRGISGEIALGVTFGVVMGKELGVAGAVAFGSAALLGVRRGYYWPIHFAFIFPEARGRWYRFHPVAWDDLCGAPFAGLHRLLVSFAESEPAAAEEEAERLIGTYLTHRSAALKAKTILLVRKAAKEDDLTRIDGLLAELPEGKKGYLKNTQTARDLVGRISVEATRLATADRPFLKEPAARAVVTEIKELRGRVAGFGEPLASELRKAADKWLVVSERQLEEERAALAKAPVGQPFRAGDPVNVEREAFVQRLSVVGELEQQVRLAEGCPGILLHGRRRVGKSTILHNLPHFLPRSFRLARVSLQDPKVFSALPDFCSGLGQAILDAVPETDRETPTNLLSLFDTLQLANQRLTKSKERLILALDEYEGVDVKIGEGVFSEDLLATIRESIQEHRQILWLFAGVHAIEELPHAPWTSYLLSARLIEVPLFSEAETRLLLTEPMKRSPLWRDREEDRPRFEPGFWSEGGIERIQAETGGWPHLVQLVAEAVVDLVNLGSLPAATPQLLEQALDKAVVRGHAVFYELMRRECTTEPEWHYLSGFRSAEVQPLPDDPEVTAALKKRWLVEASGEGLRLRVPLMGRWLRERG